MFVVNFVIWFWLVYVVYVWVVMDVFGVGGLVVFCLMNLLMYINGSVVSIRMLLVFVLFFVFGYFCINVIGYFGLC